MISAKGMRETPPIHTQATFAKMCSAIWQTADKGGQVTWYRPTHDDLTDAAVRELQDLGYKCTHSCGQIMISWQAVR